MVGHTFLFSPAVRRMKEIIDCRGHWRGAVHRGAPAESGALPEGHQRGVGPGAARHLDPAAFAGRAPVSVSCQGSSHVTRGIEDVTMMYLTFAKNRCAFIHNSWLDPKKVRQMTVVGSQRMIVYDDTEPLEKLKIYDARVEVPPHYDTFAEFTYSYHYGDAYVPYIKQDEPLEAGVPAFPGMHSREVHAHYQRPARAWRWCASWKLPANRCASKARPSSLAAVTQWNNGRTATATATDRHGNGDGNGTATDTRQLLPAWASTGRRMSSSDQLFQRIAPDVKLGQRVKIFAFTNLYGCEIGDDVKIGTFVEIQKGARVGNRCKISSHSFLCEGVTLEDEVFIGHGVTFINDRFPRATNADGTSPDRGGLDVRSHDRKAGGLDRLRRHDPVRGGDRRAGHRGGGQRGNERRSGRRRCGRQPGAPPSRSPRCRVICCCRLCKFLSLTCVHNLSRGGPCWRRRFLCSRYELCQHFSYCQRGSRARRF